MAESVFGSVSFGGVSWLRVLRGRSDPGFTCYHEQTLRECVAGSIGEEGLMDSPDGLFPVRKLQGPLDSGQKVSGGFVA